MQQISRMNGNVRQQHLTSSADNYMVAFGENKKHGPLMSNGAFELGEGSLPMKKFSKVLQAACVSIFPDTVENMTEIERGYGRKSLLGPIGVHSIDASFNLVNAAHFDNGDAGPGIGIWLSSNAKETKIWYFVLPNSSINGSKGVAIKLFHGCMIEWDGTKVKHCSMHGNDHDKDLGLVGLFMGPKTMFRKNKTKRNRVMAAKKSGLEKYKDILGSF